MNINRFILNKENCYPNIIGFSNNKKKEVLSNIVLDKNTFICWTIGYYGYKKSEKT